MNGTEKIANVEWSLVTHIRMVPPELGGLILCFRLVVDSMSFQIVVATQLTSRKMATIQFKYYLD